MKILFIQNFLECHWPATAGFFFFNLQTCKALGPLRIGGRGRDSDWLSQKGRRPQTQKALRESRAEHPQLLQGEDLTTDQRAGEHPKLWLSVTHITQDTTSESKVWRKCKSYK